MPSQGPFSPGTVTPDGFSGVAWTNPDNVKVEDATFASASLDQQATEKLRCTNLGFTIPANVTVTGVMVEIKKKSDQTGGMVDEDISPFLTKDGSSKVGNGKPDTSTLWPTVAAYAVHGGDGQLWDTTWTPSEINASTFGVVMAAEENGTSADVAYIDHIRVTVYYALPGRETRAANDQWHDRPVSVGDGMSCTGP